MKSEDIDTYINQVLYDTARATKTKKYLATEVPSAYTCFPLPQSRYVVHVYGNEIKSIVDFKTNKEKTNTKLVEEFQKEASHLKPGHYIFEIGYYTSTARFQIFEVIVKNNEILQKKKYSDRLNCLQVLNIYGEFLNTFIPNTNTIDPNSTVPWILRELDCIYEYLTEYIIEVPELPNQNYPIIGEGKLTVMTKVAISKVPYKCLSEVPILDVIKETLKKESLVASFDYEEILDEDLLDCINNNLLKLKGLLKAEKVPTVIEVRLIANTSGKIFAYVPISEASHYKIESDVESNIPPRFHNENDRDLISGYVPYKSAHIAAFKYAKTPYRTSLLKLVFVKWFSIVEFDSDGTITVPFPIGTIPYPTQNRQSNSMSRFPTPSLLKEAMLRVESVKHTKDADPKCKIFVNNLSDIIEFFNNIDSLKRKKQDEEPAAEPELKRRRTISDSGDENV